MAEISCGHVVVVPYHEKVTVVVDTSVLEVENNDHGVENKAEENDGREVKNEVVVHGELGPVVKGEQRAENKAAVNGEQEVGNEAAACSELGVVVHGVQEEMENEVEVCSELEVVVHGVQEVENEAVVHDEQGVEEGGEPGKGLVELHVDGHGDGDGHGVHDVCGEASCGRMVARPALTTHGGGGASHAQIQGAQPTVPRHRAHELVLLPVGRHSGTMQRCSKRRMQR